MTAAVQRLNHAVLYVTDAEKSAKFYVDNLGFSVAHAFPGGAFLRASGSPNDHDLGLFSIGASSSRPVRAAGLYHLAWQVDTIEELAELRTKLLAVGALVGESDHGVSKSLYCHDPDGIEFEVMWAVPRSEWAAAAMGTQRLMLDQELARWAGTPTLHESSQPASA
jgi:catechol-2,3-dioxygenase